MRSRLNGQPIATVPGPWHSQSSKKKLCTDDAPCAMEAFRHDLMQAKIPAFPGAEGGAMYTAGGRGGKVIVVTSLNDDGPGSVPLGLRAGWRPYRRVQRQRRDNAENTNHCPCTLYYYSRTDGLIRRQRLHRW